MKTLIAVALTLLTSLAAHGQPATLSSETGRLEIPNLVIDGRVALSGVDLMLTDEKTGSFNVVDYDFRPLGDNVIRAQELAFGESILFYPGMNLEFIAVLSESRCPTDVVCITAGEVTVILRLTETVAGGNTQRTDFGLTYLGTDISTFEHNGLYFRLKDVMPAPVSILDIPEEDYVIVLEYRAVPFKY